MTSSEPICQWKSSRYDNSTRKWLLGRLALFPSLLAFTPDDSAKPSVQLHLEATKNIRKETTNLIYSAVTVETRQGEKHWFSSLSNRDSTFNFLFHFWQNTSLLGDYTSRATGNQSRGGELISLVEEAQKTLAGAAVELHAQGKQLDRSAGMMRALHGDLGVSYSLLKDMGSWLDTWKASKKLVRYAKTVAKENRSKLLNAMFPVLYSLKASSRIHQPGVLTMADAKMSIADERGREAFSAAAGSSLELIGHTPYQIGIGHGSEHVQIISAVAVAIMESLSAKFHVRVQYKRPAALAHVESLHQEGQSHEELVSWTEGQDCQVSRAGSVLKVQCQEEELIAVSKGLHDMKLLAMGLREETELQIQQIGDLDVSVDKAQQRTKELTKRTRDLAS